MAQPVWTDEKIEREVRKLELFVDRTEIDGDHAIELMKQMRNEYEQGLAELLVNSESIGAEGRVITELQTEYGGVMILTSPFCPPDQIYIGDAGQLQRIAEETLNKYWGEAKE